MGNCPASCCCNLRPSNSNSNNLGQERPLILAKRNNSYMAMNKDDPAALQVVNTSAENEKVIKFGPMILREPPCRFALLVACTVDDAFFTMQNTLAKLGWQSAVAASEDEAEERITKLWPHLIVLDARRSTLARIKKVAYGPEEMVRKLRLLTQDDGTVIMAVVDRVVYDDRQQRDLIEAGASKVLKCCPRALADEVVWIERCVLPLQHRLRSCAGLFTALEHADCAVEITSYNRVVQYVNGQYEQLTGCHKDDVLGTLSSDLRRKSLPKETPGVRTAAATPVNAMKSTIKPIIDQRKGRTVSAGAVAPCSLNEKEAMNEDNGDNDANDREARNRARPTSPRPASSLPTHTLTEAVNLLANSNSSNVHGTPPSSSAQLLNPHRYADVNGWRCINAPGPSNQHQFVYLKPLANADGSKSGFYRRRPSIRINPPVDTPVSEIIAILREVQKHCGNDESIQNPIQKVVKILNSTELYSPLITRFKQGDKVASDLFGGLVLNGPVPAIHRSRKTSLSETMRDHLHKGLRSESGMFRSMSPDVRAVLQLEESWQFNIIELERLTFRRPLVHLGMKIFQRWRVDGFLQCTESAMRAWLEVMEAHYHSDNSYHNSTHAADVLQATAYYLGKEPVANILEHADAVAALLASVIHDVDHPGKGSAFLINTRHPLALLYNDVSVLESHHAALSFQLSLTDPRINIFSRLGRQDFITLRKSVVDMVLATDMNKHFEYLAKFQQTILLEEEAGANESGGSENGNSGSGGGGSGNGGAQQPAQEKERADPRRIVCRILIKCADVSNPSRPWQQCKEWAYRIVEEYFVQTAEERAKGLPLTMEVFDRDTCNVPLTQCSFIDMFIREMFRSWSKFGNMPELEARIEDNYQRWREEAKVWPKQRQMEYNRIQAYLRHRDSFRHIMNSMDGARSSVDSIGSAPPALATTTTTTSIVNQQQSPHHQQQHSTPSKESNSSSSPLLGMDAGNESRLLETTPESPIISTAPELV